MDAVYRVHNLAIFGECLSQSLVRCVPTQISVVFGNKMSKKGVLYLIIYQIVERTYPT